MKTELDMIILEIIDDIAHLTFNDPGTLNAMSGQMLADFSVALDIVEDPESNVRCLLITGAGRGFCAGANLAGMEPSSSNDKKPRRNKPLDAGDALETHYHPLLRRLRNLHCPIVTAVNGPAAGVGMSFALMGDMILAARSAFFLQAFRRIGLVPDGGSTWLLPRLVGLARAKELAIMGERLPADKAFEWGLINRLCADDTLMNEALAIARELAEGPYSLRLIRNLMWESADSAYEQQLNAERQNQRIAGRTGDFREGVSAFNDKRTARFSGK